jgi:predicted dehydrogenase
MNKPIRLGIIGFAHMHILDLVKSFFNHPEQFSWVGCADVPPVTESVSREPGTRCHIKGELADCYGISTVFEHYHHLLDEEPDVVLVTCENARHASVVCEILERGIHVILEKPMAMTLHEAENMVRAAKLNNTKLIVNWPTTWFPSFRLARQLVHDGAVGKPFRFYYRNKESLGPFSYGQNLTESEKAAEWWYQADMGGGAMADYIGYGCNLSRWFLGERAVAATAMKSNFMSLFSNVDDYSAAMLRYPTAMSILEGSWSTISSGCIPSGPVVFGEKGTLVADRRDPVVQIYLERNLSVPTKELMPGPLPKNRSDLALELLHHMETGEPIHETLDMTVNLDTMAAMDAVFQSATTGKHELIEPPSKEALS